MQRDGQRSGGDVRVVFFGDSLVAGVGDPAGAGWVGRLVAGAFDHGMPITSYNLGIRRETSADVLARWPVELAPRLTDQADCRVVFAFGANDTTWEGIGARVDPAMSVANLESVLASARQRTLPALVVGPPPINDDAQQARIVELSTAFRDVARRHGVPYAELVDGLRASATWKQELSRGDGAHPGAAGYAVIAELVMPTWLEWLGGGIARTR